MNSPVDQHLLQLVQQDVKLLENAVKHMSVESEEEKKKVLDELQKCWTSLEDMKNRVTLIEYRVHGFENRVAGVEHHITGTMYILCAFMMLVVSAFDTSSIENNFEDVHNRRVGRMESKFNGFNSSVVDLKGRDQIDDVDTENVSNLKFTSFRWSSNMNILYAYPFYRCLPKSVSIRVI